MQQINFQCIEISGPLLAIYEPDVPTCTSDSPDHVYMLFMFVTNLNQIGAFQGYWISGVYLALLQF